MSTSLGPGAASVSQTTKRVKWETDVDWDKGTIPSTLERSGTGDAAIIRTKEIVDGSGNINYTTAGDYTLSNGSLLEVAGGFGRLKSLSGDSADFPFTTSGNYTFNSAKIFVSGGVAALVDILTTAGRWHMNESTGSTASDSSGSNFDFTLVNMENADWVSGHLNNALQFDGVDEYGELPAVADLNFDKDDAFSIEFWFKSTDNTAFILSNQGDNTTFQGWAAFLAASGEVQFIHQSTGSNRIAVKTTATGFNDNNFHHVVITYDGLEAVSGVTIYIDGSSEALTTIEDTLTTTTVSAFKVNIGRRPNPSSPLHYQGLIDEVIIYNSEITAGAVTTQFNSGTGTEGPFSTDDPTIVNNTGLVFSTALDTFTETATKPTGSAIQYHVSSDNGVTFKYWDGAAWSVTDDTFTQSNTAAVVNTNIAALAGSGTFKFRGLLNSDGFVTPELDRIQVSGPNVFSTTDNLHITTKDNIQFDPTDLASWLTVVFTSTLPANTDLRVLFSVDDRVSWLTWSGTAWVAPASDTTRTDATTLADAVTNFAALPVTKPLDVRIFLNTSDSSVTPDIDNILITSDSGFETAGVYITNQFDSTELGQEWGSITFNTTEPSGGSITIKGKTANSITELTAASFGSALSNNQQTNLTGQFIQFEITFTSIPSVQLKIDNLAVDFDSPLRTLETP